MRFGPSGELLSLKRGSCTCTAPVPSAWVARRGRPIAHRALRDPALRRHRAPGAAPRRPQDAFLSPMPFRPEPPFTHGATPAGPIDTDTAVLAVQPWHAGRAHCACAAPLPGLQFLADPRVVEISCAVDADPARHHPASGRPSRPPSTPASGWPRARRSRCTPSVRPSCCRACWASAATVCAWPMRCATAARRWGPTRRSQA